MKTKHKIQVVIACIGAVGAIVVAFIQGAAKGKNEALQAYQQQTVNVQLGEITRTIDVSQIQGIVDELQSTNGDYSKRISMLESNNNSLSEQLTALENRMSELQSSSSQSPSFPTVVRSESPQSDFADATSEKQTTSLSVAGESEDSKDQIEKSEETYQTANTLMDSRKYRQALDKYRLLGDYKDSKAKISEIIQIVLRGWNFEGYQYVQFGSYPQGQNGEIEPILWRVLAVDDETLLLWSEYLLDVRRMNGYDTEDWRETELYAFLNSFEEGGFIGLAFSPLEQKQLLEQQSGHDFKPSGHVVNTPEIGSVFLLNDEQLHNQDYGLSEMKNQIGLPTQYVKQKYSFETDSFWHHTACEYYYISTYYYGRWLIMSSTGNINYNYGVSSSNYYSVRPACRILKSNYFVTGSGTKDDPFRLE